MATGSKKRKSSGSKRRFIGKPTGLIGQRVQEAGPEHFGIIAVDCAKRRSKWMLCDFFGKVLIEPTSVEHTAGGLQTMTQHVTDACEAEGLTDTIVAIEMTGIYHKPVYRAFRKAGFDTRIVHPFASKHYRRPLHPDEKTDDKDLEAIFHAAARGCLVRVKSHLHITESFSWTYSLNSRAKRLRPCASRWKTGGW